MRENKKRNQHIMALIEQGYTYREIAQLCKISKQRVAQIKKAVDQKTHE